MDDGKRKFDFAELLAVDMLAARETFLGSEQEFVETQ